MSAPLEWRRESLKWPPLLTSSPKRLSAFRICKSTQNTNTLWLHKKKVEWVTGLSLKFSVGCKRLKFLDLIKTLIAITTVWHVEKNAGFALEYLVSYRVINRDWCGLIIALVQKRRLETTSTFALLDKCTQSFFFRIEPIHIDHPVAGWYSAAHSWLDQQWQISFESHKRVSSLSLFLRRSFFARISYPWVSVSNWWSHGSVKTPWQPKKKSQKNQGSKSVWSSSRSPSLAQQHSTTLPSPDSSSNWIRCSLFFSCRLYILHFGYIHTHMYHNIMLYASLNFSSFMILQLRCACCWGI